MALIVENGTGMSTAESFASVSAYKAWCDLRGYSYSAYSDTNIETALRRASSFLSLGIVWKGYRTNGRNQALAWPRAGMNDREGLPVSVDELPTELLEATYEVTRRELASPGTMTPDYIASERTKREKIGEVEIEYAAISSAEASRPVLLVLDDLLGAFMMGSTEAAAGGMSVVGISR